MVDLQALIKPYSPWISSETRDDWQRLTGSLPEFHRPIFDQLVDDLESIEQIISVTGPRRVGKSTLLWQLVKYLLDEQSVDPSRIVYYSFDDPALFRPGIDGGEIIEALMEHLCELGREAQTYLFLDEIQKLDRWEQYLKKYYDLKYPIRVVVSGSASSPIFKKSRESLLGRVKDYHVLPFSFREFLLYRLQGQSKLLTEVDETTSAGIDIKGMLTKDPAHIDTSKVTFSPLSDDLWTESRIALEQYLVEGGFPEVWSLPTAEKKLDYLFDNQVNKVILEDLVLAVELRKPEQLKQFYVSLLEQPGREVNLTSLSQDIGVNVQQIEKYLPMLEMTDLLAFAAKFRPSPVRVRRGNRKYYLVDLALRNAVLRIGEELLDDPAMMGLYAENLVFNALRKWKGILQIDYFRDRSSEVDFIVHTNPNRYLPVEVKYREHVNLQELPGLRRFSDRYSCHRRMIVTKNREDFGKKDDLFLLPLIQFLLMFD